MGGNITGTNVCVKRTGEKKFGHGQAEKLRFANRLPPQSALAPTTRTSAMPRLALLGLGFVVSFATAALAQTPPAPAPHALQYFLTEPAPAIASLKFPDGARNPARSEERRVG